MIKFKCGDEETKVYNIIKDFYNEYNHLTKDELLENSQDVQDEICKSLQKTYGADYIVGVNFATLTVQ